MKSERQRMSECEDIAIQSVGTYTSGFGTIKKKRRYMLKKVGTFSAGHLTSPVWTGSMQKRAKRTVYLM